MRRQLPTAAPFTEIARRDNGVHPAAWDRRGQHPNVT
jgi:hypothetical protein